MVSDRYFVVAFSEDLVQVNDHENNSSYMLSILRRPDYMSDDEWEQFKKDNNTTDELSKMTSKEYAKHVQAELNGTDT